jgi:hypothetical protein
MTYDISMTVSCDKYLTAWPIRRHVALKYFLKTMVTVETFEVQTGSEYLHIWGLIIGRERDVSEELYLLGYNAV